MPYGLTSASDTTRFRTALDAPAFFSFSNSPVTPIIRLSGSPVILISSTTIQSTAVPHPSSYAGLSQMSQINGVISEKSPTATTEEMQKNTKVSCRRIS